MGKLPQLSAVLAVIVTLSSSSVVKSPSDGTFELLILHNNDMHARFEQTSQLSGACTTADREAGKCYGGFPRVAHVVKEARAAAASGQGPPVLYLNAGDTYTGTAWFTIYKWKVAAEFLNALQPDAVSLGNHEFDNGVSGLTPFIESLTCPILAANLVLNKEPTLQAEHNLMKSVVFNINGTKVGVIGYLTPDTKVVAMRNDVEYIEEVVAIRNEAQKLKEQGINILIALGHSGFTKDLEIAEKVEDIDIVIGGHTNTFLWNGTSPDIEKAEGAYPAVIKQKSNKIALVVEAYAYTKYLGQLNVIFDSQGEIVSYKGNPILLDKSVPQDPDVGTIVKQYREDVLKISEVVVGNTSVLLDGQSCRIKECNLGNLITDAMVNKYALEYKGEGWTDAPIAIIQGGGIRASVKHIHLPADITRGDLFNVMPFDGYLVKITLNGTIIWKMLEHAVAQYSVISPPGMLLQVSGLKVEYNLKKPPGQRVSKVQALCGICEIPTYNPVKKNDNYSILAPSFLAFGGDGYSMFNDLFMKKLNYGELDATVEYVKKISPIHSAVEDRIKMYLFDKLANSANIAYLSAICMALSLLTLSSLIIGSKDNFC